jgi:hypothetical protein
MKRKVLVILLLLLVSMFVGPSPVQAASCQHVPSIWVARIEIYVITVNWECPANSNQARTGQITVKVPNGLVPGYHYETYGLQEFSGIEDPPTSILWNIPPNPFPGHFQAVNQGWYQVVSGYVVVWPSATRYYITATGMELKVCLPNPYGC